MYCRGAKTAMSAALRSPETVAKVVAVDNAPVDVTLSRTFASYVRGMKKIEEAKVTRQSEADAILRDYEEVNQRRCCSFIRLSSRLTVSCNSRSRSASSCSGTCIAHLRTASRGFASPWTSSVDHSTTSETFPTRTQGRHATRSPPSLFEAPRANTCRTTCFPSLASFSRAFDWPTSMPATG